MQRFDEDSDDDEVTAPGRPSVLPPPSLANERGKPGSSGDAHEPDGSSPRMPPGVAS